MPFTPAHVAAVLPLMRGRAATVLVAPALAIGAMTPDLPLFVASRSGFTTVGQAYAHTHSWSGLVTWDLVIGLVVLAGWLVAWRPLADLAPRWVRERLPEPNRLGPRQWLLAAVSVVLGAATHVVWDGFTHTGRFGVRWIPSLEDHVAGIEAFRWLQYLSGVVGVVVVAVVAWRALRRRTPDTPDAGVLRPRERVLAWAAILLAVLGTVAFMAVRILARLWTMTYELAAYLMVTRSIGVLLAAVAVWTVVWHLVRRVRRPDLRPDGPGRRDVARVGS